METGSKKRGNGRRHQWKINASHDDIFNAGLEADRIKLALEPEVASIWCQNVTTDLKGELARSGMQYMVLDLGGKD
ncbi:hypothetical protein MAR_008753 [Mya arenaria]|uniref:Uncharacterized protein n=1 Tax=Mya arenaria TaxID=6604 RepID=A0ABY7DWT8_MYAAR|nr:hypothetical protein MAR_008753 [Mya arenaria]